MLAICPQDEIGSVLIASNNLNFGTFEIDAFYAGTKVNRCTLCASFLVKDPAEVSSMNQEMRVLEPLIDARVKVLFVEFLSMVRTNYQVMRLYCILLDFV